MFTTDRERRLVGEESSISISRLCGMDTIDFPLKQHTYDFWSHCFIAHSCRTFYDFPRRFTKSENNNITVNFTAGSRSWVIAFVHWVWCVTRSSHQNETFCRFSKNRWMMIRVTHTHTICFYVCWKTVERKVRSTGIKRKLSQIVKGYEILFIPI